MSRRTCDHPPTLTDSQVLEFCRQGFLMLPGAVPEQINRRAFEYLETDTHYEPTRILDFDWFQDQVICNPTAAGAVRSLLGPGYGLPVLMSNHRRQCPHEGVGGWHVDGGSRWGPQLKDLQVFYYPQDTPVEMGPTEVVPGTHLVPNTQRAMAHYGRIRGSASTAAPAGTIFITCYRIWHRATAAPGSGIRNLLSTVTGAAPPRPATGCGSRASIWPAPTSAARPLASASSSMSVTRRRRCSAGWPGSIPTIR